MVAWHVENNLLDTMSLLQELIVKPGANQPGNDHPLAQHADSQWNLHFQVTAPMHKCTHLEAPYKSLLCSCKTVCWRHGGHNTCMAPVARSGS